MKRYAFTLKAGSLVVNATDESDAWEALQGQVNDDYWMDLWQLKKEEEDNNDYTDGSRRANQP